MGIFDDQVQVFTVFHTRLQIRDKIMGGIPKDPKTIEGWIRTKAGLTEDTEELRQAVLRTLRELGQDIPDDLSFEEAVKASESVATNQAVGFKWDPFIGLYLESRCVKACLKESANIWLQAVKNKKYGAKKTTGPKNYMAEHVFIAPDKIALGVREPSGSRLFIGHTSGPQGPQSNLTYYEFVDRPILEFDVKVGATDIAEEDWHGLWVMAQEVGLGSLRSQGFGCFDIERWDVVPMAEPSRSRSTDLVPALR